MSRDELPVTEMPCKRIWDVKEISRKEKQPQPWAMAER